VQQVCLNGHQITDSYNRSPEFRRKHCEKCGAATLHKCQSCSSPIKGDYHVEGVITIGRSTPVPRFCENCGKPFPWSDLVKSGDDEVTKLDPMIAVERICSRFPLVVRQLRIRHNDREPLDVTDEFDVQDLLHSLLHLFFD